MKHRIAALIAGIVAVTVITGVAVAEEHGQGMQHGKIMQDQQEMSGRKKGMMKDMPMMQGGMMGGMMKRQVVATSDGGVIIIVGNLLIKYDKDLELVEKTAIEISDEDMQRMTKTMKQHRGMCREMCQEKREDAAEADE